MTFRTFSVLMIVGGILAIAVRRHVSYPIFGGRYQRAAEMLQIIIGVFAMLFGAVGLFLHE